MSHTILVIEDEAPIRANLLRFLALEGYRTVEAENGRIGLERARAERPDLILCDVMMPEMDGFAVIAAVREDPNLSSVPFIFLTASAEKEALAAGLSLGASDYVTKPFQIGELAALVRRRLAVDS
jgi:CheY-like chemotaxis protein